MSDKTCCGACGYPVHATKEMACDWCRQAADRIEALTAKLTEAIKLAELIRRYAGMGMNPSTDLQHMASDLLAILKGDTP